MPARPSSRAGTRSARARRRTRPEPTASDRAARAAAGRAGSARRSRCRGSAARARASRRCWWRASTSGARRSSPPTASPGRRTRRPAGRPPARSRAPEAWRRAERGASDARTASSPQEGQEAARGRRSPGGMRILAAAFSCALCALALAGSAGAIGAIGVTEDAGKYSRDGGGPFFAQLADLGMNENAITIYWDPSLPGGMAEPGLLDRTLPAAAARGIRIVLAVYARRPAQFTQSPTAEAQFTDFLERLALAYPEVRGFVVGNDPNQPRFWQPQFAPDGSEAAGAAYEQLLARCYDVLKGVNPAIRVIGLGLSERGNDDPRAPSNASTSPVRFIQALGAAYYASGRERPIMDALAYHPYPGSSTDPLSKGLPWPNASVANLDRIKQAVWDAFHGTAQPTLENGLGLVVSEVGWQVGVVGASASAYRGRENVATTDEATQAAIYGELVRRLSCDPDVTDLLFLHLTDESDPSRCP